MIVLKHVLIRLQIKVHVVLRVLTEADRPILVHDASHFHYVPSCQLPFIFVPDNLHFLA